MSGARKRKRTTAMTQGLISLRDAEVACKRATSLAKKFTPSVAKSWDYCGDGFQELLHKEDKKSMRQDLKVVRNLAPALHSAEDTTNTGSQNLEESAEIVWSSSESDLSDGEVKTSNSRVTEERRSVLKSQSTANTSHKYSCMLNSLTSSQSSEEELAIDWDSVSDDEGEISDQNERSLDIRCTDSDASVSSKARCRESATPQSESLTVAEDILEFSSDNESTTEQDKAEKSTPSTSTQPNLSVSESGRDRPSVRSASDWLKCAQAFLHTPEKQKRNTLKTPEDSAKKKRKFLRGGLAERLNRLLCRERSSINFWRHQSLTDSRIHIGENEGVLMVKILELHEECSMFVALCQPLIETSMEQVIKYDDSDTKTLLTILFTRETASHLRMCAGDTVHIHPPWQKLEVQGEKSPVILCTYFSRKIFSEKIAGTKVKDCSPEKLPVLKKAPMSLAVKFNLTDAGEKYSSTDEDIALTTGKTQSKPSQQEKPIQVLDFEYHFAANSVCDSLLEVIESQGATGWGKKNLKVVIQRVYCLPVKDTHNQLIRSTLMDNSQYSNVGQQNARLCLLVQDSYGLFSEVHQQTFCSLEEDLQSNNACWEGKTCYLREMKILQRTTRGRSSGLFSLIESLWPPLVLPKVHGQSQDSQEHIKLASDEIMPVPSFCYVLAPLPGEGGVEVLQNETTSDLYRPAAIHDLKYILQQIPENQRCSFQAKVIYRKVQDQKSTQLSGMNDWLFVTDSTLQSASVAFGLPRTISICVTSFCMLSSEIMKSLNDGISNSIMFKDAIVETDSVVCAEGTVLSLQKSVSQCNENQGTSALTGQVILDELSATTKVNSICTVQGSVVGVDETTSFSWIVCNKCGNGKLEKVLGECDLFHCHQCGQSVTTPLTKIQLEVFLHCPVLPNCTIKVKLREPSISTLLMHSSRDEEGYEVDCVLGKEVGPLSCFVRSSVTNHPAIWIGLEEISLLEVVTQPQ
ncbi:DNA repair-scaffolding protein isoform X1 [Leucoraja erinacea]|uniref:DNA repair-scaffolding protein isoform X1 n=2 Tax=Leucoraja erinaceus TaxID=7782 RepID=UPI002459078A|nr:DNA repair-scaffolding protein isoform X1 [Leucoraja erinacea]